MKRIVVGLMILGLVIGGFLSCVLNGPADAVDQTQVDSVLATLSADGAFGQAIGRTIVTGEVVDGWEYADSGALGDATIESLIFATDGTWEYKLMDYERATKTSTSPPYDQTIQGTGRLWIQTAGYKGTYSYDATTKLLTVNYNGIQWDNTLATPAYKGVWSATNDPSATEQVMKSKPFVFKTFTFDADGNSNMVTVDDITAFKVGLNESTVLDRLLAVFAEGTDGYMYFGSDYVVTTKVWPAVPDVTAPKYVITTATETATFADTEVSYQKVTVEKTEATTPTYVVTPVNKVVYEVELSRALADGYVSTFTKAILIKTYALTGNDTTGSYTTATTPTTSYTNALSLVVPGGTASNYYVLNGPGAFDVKSVQQYGDGFIVILD